MTDTPRKPPLFPPEAYRCSAPPGTGRWKFRSRTFEGVAAACAAQWAAPTQLQQEGHP